MTDTRTASPKVPHNMFIPHALKPVQADKMTVKLYPIINLTMKLPKRAHAFHVSKTVLMAPGIDRYVMLDVLGAQLNLSTIVNGIRSDWYRHYRRNWSNFNNLTILLFHNDSGAQVDDTTTAKDSAVLLPVTNGPIPSCHKQNIRFVWVQMNLNFASLVTLDNPGVIVFAR
jgi:hypothetical protein